MDGISKLKETNTFTVKYGGKLITIDLTKELSINESIINTQLKESPSSYAYLCKIRNYYIRKKDNLEHEKDNAYSKAWVYHKESSNNLNNDTVSHKANCNSKYLTLCKKYNKVVYIVNMLNNICRAYERREDILRTVSANLRKEH